MNLDKFTGPGSTPSRRAFWDKVAEAVLASQKREGRNASVDEHQGQGTVINFPDQTPSTPTTPMGACCFHDGSCIVESESDCADDGGSYQGDGTVCDPNPCTLCLIAIENLEGCQGSGSGATSDDAWADAITHWMSCDTPLFLPLGTIARGDKSDEGLQAAAGDSPLQFTLTDSPTSSATVSGNINVYDDIAGLVDTAPFSFTLTGIGDTHTLDATPFEPVNPGPFPAINKTLTKVEDIVWVCE